MSVFKPRSRQDKDYRQISLLAAVPALLLAAPLIGWFIGQWLDARFGTDPYLMTVGVFFGLGSAGIEIFRLVKKSSKLEEEDDERHTGT